MHTNSENIFRVQPYQCFSFVVFLTAAPSSVKFGLGEYGNFGFN